MADEETPAQEPQPVPAQGQTALAAETTNSGSPPQKAKGGRPPKGRGAPKSSDKGEDRWTIRGVPSNVRKLALAEAERRGLTLGDFVAEALVGYLRGKSAADGAAAAKDAKAVTVAGQADLAEQVATVLDRLRLIEERQNVGLFGRLFGRRA